MKLNDCPLCDSPYVGTYYFDGKYNVSCEDCGIRTQNYDTEEEAQLAWNRLITRRKSVDMSKYESSNMWTTKTVYYEPQTLKLRYKKFYSSAVVPQKGDPYAACYDLYCPKNISLDATNGLYMVPLGIAVEIPVGYHAKIYPRSSMPLKYKATLANSVGIIDSGYLDEWRLIIEPISWKANDNLIFCAACAEGAKLAQVEFVRNGLDVEFEEVEDFGDSYDRGGGFGSTGK